MRPNSSGDSIIYRSGMNPKIGRNPSISLGTLSLSKGFEVLSPCDFIERILRRLGVWEAGVWVESARDPPQPAEPIIEPWLEDPLPACPR